MTGPAARCLLGSMGVPATIIDTHQHVFWHGRDDAGLVRDMDEHGIALAWLLTWEIAPSEDLPAYHRFLNPCRLRPDGTHAGIPLDDLLRARERHPDRFLLGYCPHPAFGDAPELLRAAVAMHDVRVCGEWKFRMLFDDPRCLEVFRVAGELGLPVVLHLDIPYLRDAATGKRLYQSAWFGGTVENLERALLACPETTFIGHAPGFWREISADAGDDPELYPKGPVKAPGRLYELFARYPNLYGDLSASSGRTALARDPEHGKAFLERFSDRLLFARDYYGASLYEFLQGLVLDDETSARIYFRNAEALLRDDGRRARARREVLI